MKEIRSIWNYGRKYKYVCFFSLLAISTAVFIIFRQQPHALDAFYKPMRPVYSGDYGRASVANLTKFRRSLMREVLGNAPLGYNKEGLSRYDLYPSDVVHCPPGGWVTVRRAMVMGRAEHMADAWGRMWSTARQVGDSKPFCSGKWR